MQQSNVDESFTTDSMQLLPVHTKISNFHASQEHVRHKSIHISRSRGIHEFPAVLESQPGAVFDESRSRYQLHCSRIHYIWCPSLHDEVRDFKYDSPFSTLALPSITAWGLPPWMPGIPSKDSHKIGEE